MENQMKDKYLYLGMIPTCIILTIVFSLLSITATYGIQYLEEDEIAYYTEFAESILNDKSNSAKDSTLKYILTDESITISSSNIFQQTVTVYFLETSNNIVVNNPTVNFYGCSIFFGILALFFLIGVAVFIVKYINELKKANPSKEPVMQSI